MSESQSQSEMICVRCKSSVIEAIFCIGCNAPYHSSCAKLVPKLENGAFSKCCKNKTQSTHEQSSSSLSPGLTADTIEKIINGAVSRAVTALNVKFSNVTDSVNILSNKMDSIAITMEDAVSRIGSTERRVDVLHDKVEILEGIVADITNYSRQNIDVNSVSRACLDEINDRIKRNKNLVLFGLVESSSNSSVDSVKNNDKLKIVNLLSKFSEPTLFEGVKLYRLGSFAQDQLKPRPVKLICPSEEIAKQIYQSFILAKKEKNQMSHMANWRI